MGIINESINILLGVLVGMLVAFMIVLIVPSRKHGAKYKTVGTEGIIPDHPNCRCVMLLPYIGTEKEFTVTAYCPCEKCCGRFADGITASGYVIQPGDKIVAAPKEYPFGTLMLIEGYSNDLVMVRDRGGSIKGDRLDVFFHTHQEAKNWGRLQVMVRIYKGAEK